MLEFESFVFLDVQKTGSSFIRDLLKRHCLERPIRRLKHAGVGEHYNKNKFHFMSIRNPLDQYVSLYSYGCQGKGDIFLRLKRAGMRHLYTADSKGFEVWLDFVLDKSNSALLDEHYGSGELEGLANLIGLQSYRVLLLSLPAARELLASCRTRKEIVDVYHENNIVDYIVRYERFQSDLRELLSTKLHDCVSAEALQYLETAAPRNASPRIDGKDKRLTLGEGQEKRLAEREWIVYELFGYVSP